MSKKNPSIATISQNIYKIQGLKLVQSIFFFVLGFAFVFVFLSLYDPEVDLYLIINYPFGVILIIYGILEIISGILISRSFFCKSTLLGFLFIIFGAGSFFFYYLIFLDLFLISILCLIRSIIGFKKKDGGGLYLTFFIFSLLLTLFFVVGHLFFGSDDITSPDYGGKSFPERMACFAIGVILMFSSVLLGIKNMKKIENTQRLLDEQKEFEMKIKREKSMNSFSSASYVNKNNKQKKEKVIEEEDISLNQKTTQSTPQSQQQGTPASNPNPTPTTPFTRVKNPFSFSKTPSVNINENASASSNPNIEQDPFKAQNRPRPKASPFLGAKSISIKEMKQKPHGQRNSPYGNVNDSPTIIDARLDIYDDED